jgi:SAM-dependent methyltransferase
MNEQQIAHTHSHGHMWFFGFAGLAAGLVLLVYAPTLKAVSTSLLLFAGFHIAGGIVLLSTLWYGGLRSHFSQRISPRGKSLDFGWEPGWTNGLAVAALISISFAVMVQVAFVALWALADLLLLVGATFFCGFLLMRATRRPDHAVLPMLDFLRGGSNFVLDAGCGAGRTTIALGRADKDCHIVALDRFDAGYIEQGGRALIERNLQIAGLSGRVHVETGDLTAIPYAQDTFDALVSTHVYDHLGRRKEDAMRDAFRVLKPGGRALLGLSVPSWAMFAVGSVLSFLLTSKAEWRNMSQRAGFIVRDDCAANGVWFLLLEKPTDVASADG